MGSSRAIFLTVCLILIGIFWAVGGNEVTDVVPYYVQRVLGKSAVVTAHGTTFQVEVERSVEARAKGLSGRHSLGYDHGMLFIFPSADQYEFWMQDMHFNLDIVWIRNGVIVDISRNVPAPNAGATPARVLPKEKADTILEVRVGTTMGWTVGDSIQVLNDRPLFRRGSP